MGGIDFGASINERLPFDSLVLAGVALATIVAIPLTVLAWAAWTRAARTGAIALVAGVLLIGWIVLQIFVIQRFSLFQPFYLGIGAYFIAASHKVRLSPGRRGILLVIVGSIIAATGVGLSPHLIKNGVTFMSAISAVVLVVGITMTVVGVRSGLGDRPMLGKLAVSATTLIVLAAAVSTVAPAVAATSTPSTRVSLTPAALGLDFEPVRLTTTDGVELAAWYLPGTNGAGLVVRHGAGSTRSAVLDRAEVLVGSGYGALLIDARGHGDSGGTAMDFGWYGDLDIAAGTAYLASRADIDPARIGVVGFSMGGEEAIGAAASDPLIRAVVAEGATARQAADKVWLSDTYGWRGSIQESLERVQDRVTDFLTDASPPISLRSATTNATSTPFLLITAGNVPDEDHAAAYMKSGASERVTVWSVDGADHTGGFDIRPEEWRQRVVAFLDASLM
jgi:fermentation-respiration switch protein FrsA (DUF1100 family)